jgi:hypothetical protein
VVGVEADRVVVGVLEVAPRLAGEGDKVGGELSVRGVVLQGPQARDVVEG